MLLWMILSPSKTKDVVKDELSRWETFPAVHFICVFFSKSVNLLAWWNKSPRMTFSLKLTEREDMTLTLHMAQLIYSTTRHQLTMQRVWTSSRTMARLFHHRLLLPTLLELDRPIPPPTPLPLHSAAQHIFRRKFHKSCGQRRLLLESGLHLRNSLCAAPILRQSPLQLALIFRIIAIINIRISVRSQSIRLSMFILMSIHVSLSMTALAEQPFSPIDESDDWSRA